MDPDGKFRVRRSMVVIKIKIGMEGWKDLGKCLL